MLDAPDISELVASVRLFISETARPQLSGHAAFHARVAENVLAIVERELADGEAARQAARGRLRVLVGGGNEDSLDTLTRKLCDAIRNGEMTHTSPGLLAHLKATAIDELKIDQPKYSGLALATKTGQNPAE